MRRSRGIVLCGLMALLLPLASCQGYENLAPRSQIGDGSQPLLPLASDETVTIGYPVEKSWKRVVNVTILPEGRIVFETYDASRRPKPVLTKRISAKELAQLRDQLAAFRPPAGAAGEASWFLPVGCGVVDDGGSYASLVFDRHGQDQRLLQIPTSGCKTSIAERLSLRLRPILNDEPINARAAGLTF